MQQLDANALIAWNRADHPHHMAMTDWMADVIESREPFGAHDLAWTAFLRICSNRKIFPVPSPLPTLFDFRRSVVAQRRYLPVTTSAQQWVEIERLCTTHPTRPNLVNDVVLAVAALDEGATFVSMDSDFARFERLRWVNPRSV